MLAIRNEVDSKLEGVAESIVGRVKDYEAGMMMQEQTIELILNSI